VSNPRAGTALGWLAFLGLVLTAAGIVLAYHTPHLAPHAAVYGASLTASAIAVEYLRERLGEVAR
jgi:hypothetical protein